MDTNNIQPCAQFDSKGGCKYPAETLWGGYALDFCAMHNHMAKTGIPLKCWRCGDDSIICPKICE